MAISDESTGFYMPVAPAYNNGGGFGGLGGDWGWIILLLLAFNGGFGGFGGMDGLYPWLNNSQNVNGGFRDQMLNSSINGIQNGVTSGFGDTQTALCGGFAGVNSAINNAQSALSQQMYANQIADMERSFAAQTASTAGMTGLQSQLAQCCCDNRAATADLKYTVATENCADRTAALQNTRDIIESQTRSTQAILDKLCALELDGVKSQLAQAQRENVGLQNQINMANLAASQTAQTAQILAGQAAEIDGVYNRLKNCPVGTYSVCNPLASTGCGY